MKSKERDTNIEFIRIVACISVIALHTWIGSGIDEVPVICKGVIRVFERHGVPIFFMIMGFFLFSSSKSYRTRVSDVAKRIIIPFVIAYFAYEYLQDWLQGTRTFLECMISPSVRIGDILYGLLQGQTGYNSSFWYIFEYIKVIIYTPLLSLICHDEPRLNRLRRGYMLLCILFLICQNVFLVIVNWGGREITVVDWSPLDLFMLYVMIGYEISIIRGAVTDRIKSSRIWLLFSYAAFNLLVCCEEYVNIKKGGINSAFFSENSLFHIAAAVSIFLFLRSFEGPVGRTGKMIVVIGSVTYYVYLIHWSLVKLVSTRGLPAPFNHIPSLIRYFVTVLFVFMLSVLVAFILKTPEYIIRNRIKSENKDDHYKDSF